MAVLIEALNVVVKDESIRKKFIGGIDEFYRTLPNSTHCTDNELHRIGFMAPNDVEKYVYFLTDNGLVFSNGYNCLDIVVVDMNRGATLKCEWLGLMKCSIFNYKLQSKDSDISIIAAYLLPEHGGTNKDRTEAKISFPMNWSPETAIKPYNFVPDDEIKNKLIELEDNNGTKKFWHSETGDFVYSGRANIKILCLDIKDGVTEHFGNYPFLIFWQPVTEQIARRFGINFPIDSLPFMIQEENLKKYETGEDIEPTEYMLMAGMIISLNEQQEMLNKPYFEFLVSFVDSYAKRIEEETREKLLLDFAFYLNQNVCPYCSYLSLKGSLLIEKESSKIKSDLLMNIGDILKKEPNRFEDFHKEIMEIFYQINLDEIYPDAAMMCIYITLSTLAILKSHNLKEFNGKYFRFIINNTVRTKIQNVLEMENPTIQDTFIF